MEPMKIAVDGRSLFGSYECQCECGLTWKGEGEELRPGLYSPALPIAEAVVHMKMCHPELQLDLRMTADFQHWLTHYWEISSLRVATAIEIGYARVDRHDVAG